MGLGSPVIIIVMRLVLLGLLGTLGLLVPAAGASTPVCPNEALRSELHSGSLPDCRAYELVTPVYKEGQMQVGQSVYAISQDGAHMISTSFGAFAGAEEDRLSSDGRFLGDVYELSRAGSGWRAFSLGPPASAYLSAGMLDASADLSRSLWRLSPRPAEVSPETSQENLSVADLYLESTPGTFVDIGRPTPNPTTPNKNRYLYLGGSEDLSHVLFSTEPGFHWPFDDTAPSSSPLYEYVGAGNATPMLVGVIGGRESHELLSKCGTRLGSSEPAGGGSMYNAISTSGSRVFFTAVGTDEVSGCEGPPVAELFAREELPLASGEPPPAKMRTVAISEPTAEDCTLCITSEGSRATAVFQGASRDGSKAFFMTAQELLPGAKGENLYEYDFNGPPGGRISLASGGAQSEQAEVQGVARVAEDGSSVYFVATGKLTAAPNAQGRSAEAGKDNLYVYERDEAHPAGQTSYATTLSPGDAADWMREDRRRVLLSVDDRFLVFLSGGDLRQEGTGGSQVYQYDSRTGALVRVSIGQEGFNGDGKSVSSSLQSRLPIADSYSVKDSPTQVAGVLAPADGAVFFESAGALTPNALNDQPDDLGEELTPNVYEYRDGSVYLISDGRDTSVVSGGPAVNLIGWSTSGDDAFLSMSDSLITQDTDTQQDVYDARVNGGFPTSATRPACEEEGGETCLGTPSVTPAPKGTLAAPAPELAGVTPAVAAPSLAKPRAKKAKHPTRKKHGKKHKAKGKGHGHAHAK
jgi:hypothetical protein